MASRKKQHSINFTTTAPMEAIMSIVSKLYEAGSIQNLEVKEVGPVASVLETS